MNSYSLFFIILLMFSCQPEHKSDFNQDALNQVVYDTEMNKSTIGDIIEQNKGKKIILDIWASWCKDCVKSLPDISNFQDAHPEVQWVFLSVDDDKEDWQNGLAKYMDKYDIQGDQYFFDTGWTKEGDNAFTEYIELDWIPRYVLLDQNGQILVYYAKDITDNHIKKHFK